MCDSTFSQLFRSPGIVRKCLNNINKTKILKYSTHLFACSKLAGDWMFGGVNNDKVKIVNNAINASDYSFNLNLRKKVREKLGLEGKLVVGHVGRFALSEKS